SEARPRLVAGFRRFASKRSHARELACAAPPQGHDVIGEGASKATAHNRRRALSQTSPCRRLRLRFWLVVRAIIDRTRWFNPSIAGGEGKGQSENHPRDRQWLSRAAYSKRRCVGAAGFRCGSGARSVERQRVGSPPTPNPAPQGGGGRVAHA